MNAKQEGRRAYLSGAENPYDYHTKSFNDWEDGYGEAWLEDEAEQDSEGVDDE